METLCLRLDDGETAVFECGGNVTVRVTHVHKSGRRAKLVVEAPKAVRVHREMPNQFDLTRLRRA